MLQGDPSPEPAAKAGADSKWRRASKEESPVRFARHVQDYKTSLGVCIGALL